MDALARLVSRRAPAVLGLLLAVSALALAAVVDLRTGGLRVAFDPSLEALLPRDTPARAYYDRVRELFGSDEVLVLALADPEGIFTPEHLAAVRRLTDRIETLEGVHHVTSLATALEIRAAGDELEIEPFLSELPRTREEAEAIRRAALGNPIYAGNLVNREGTATALFIYLDEMPEAVFLESGLEERIRAAADEERGTARAMLTGGAVVKAAQARSASRDIARTMPLVTLVMAAVAAFAFRSWLGVLVPLVTIGLGTLWTAAVIAWIGRPLNVITLIVPAIVQTIGFAYALHVVSAWQEALRARGPGGGRRELARWALAEVALPLLLTALTTAVGFLSLAASPLAAVREFGLLSVVAVIATAAAALLFAPAVLALAPFPRRFATDAGRAPDRFGSLMARLARFDLRHRGAILAASALVALVALLGVGRIRVSLERVGVFPPDHPVRADYEAINRELEGSSLFYVVLEADYRDAFKEPVNLEAIRALQQWLEAQPEIGGTTSLVDYVSLIHRAFRGGDPDAQRIPDSKRLVSQLLFFGGNDELDRVVDSQYQITSVAVRSRVLDTAAVGELARRIEARLRELPEHLEGRVTGNLVLMTEATDALSRGQATSLSLAFVLIYAILALLFTSLRVGALALIPNALPVLLFFGALGLSGVTLNPATSLVACIALGIAVDDTIHFLARFNGAARAAGDEARGAVDALRTVGRPVTFSTLALCLGFLVLCTSEMRTQVQFGALAAFTLASAWLVDVTLTPALCSRLRVVGLWEVLSLDLGRDPTESIPLFRGLRNAQARVVALMMEIRELPASASVFRVGEGGDDMYAVLDGELEVHLPGAGGSETVATLRRGDAVGEVALFSGVRSADVVARTPVRLLRFTRADLDRLRRRYPRIAARVLENLSGILAGRMLEANRDRSRWRAAAPAVGSSPTAS